MVDASLRATILDSLRQLNRDYGMSIVYITHDLITAYQISDAIMVLYRGTVAEAGDVDLVVRQPRHPYTQLLINSVPQPDPNHEWGAIQVRDEEPNGSMTQIQVASSGIVTSAAAAASATPKPRRST